MTLKSDSQRENALKGKIKALLIQLRSLGMSEPPEIARILGYTKNPFRKLDTDDNYEGSTQLLAAMELLLQLEELKVKLNRWNQFEAMVREIAQQNSRVQYPPPIGDTGGAHLNEPASSERLSGAKELTERAGGVPQKDET